MLKRVHEALAAVLRERSLDWRTCYTSVFLSRPDGSQLRVEASDADVLSDLAGRLETLAAGSAWTISYVRLPAPGSGLPERYLAASSVVDVRKEAAHSAELLTQVTYGDLVLPLKSEGDWILAKLEDGYVGWIRSWNLKPTTLSLSRVFAERAGHRVKYNIIQAFERPTIESLPVTDAVVGTPIVVRDCQKRGWRFVEFPDGKTGYAVAGSLQRIPKMNRISREQLSATGMRFMGIPYLWGGTSPKGFDCSGLMQKIFSLNGLLLPRDSHMQARYGKMKSITKIDSFYTGDLLFFGADADKITHVAMYLSNGLFLHAFGYVRVGSLDPKNPLFDAKLSKDWQSVRDALAL